MYKYNVKEIIGKGSFGTVHKAEEKASNKSVALKIILKTDYTPKQWKTFEKECGIHAKLSHPNIISMLDSFETTDLIVVVTERADIDLHKFMKQQTNHKLPEDHAQKITWDLLSALHYLHSYRILHRDLKPQNILLNMNGLQAKLCDFGFARNMTSQTLLLTSVKGTPLYMAPEVIKDEPYDQKADLWSVGCIMYQMLSGQAPFEAKSFSHLWNLLRREDINWLKIKVTKDCESFLKSLLIKDQSLRLAWPDILNHPFVKDHLTIVNDNAIELPLTNILTASQNLEKEKQRDEIILKKEKMNIADRNNLSELSKPNRPTVVCDGKQQQAITTDDNESISSQDSVHAIVQTDIENIETDVETIPNNSSTIYTAKEITKQTNHMPNSYCSSFQENLNLIVNRFADNFILEKQNESSGSRPNKLITNKNLAVGTITKKLKNDALDLNKPYDHKQMNCTVVQPTEQNNGIKQDLVENMSPASPQESTNKDLEKRKLSQNLDNFLIRLGNSHLVVTDVRDHENESCVKPSDINKTVKKEKSIPAVDTKWNTCDDYQSSPIENEEWLAFIRASMQEVLNGEIESIKQQNLVEIIVAILRNFNASTKVIESVVQLLSIPLVMSIPAIHLIEIKNIYEQTKLLPNLIFASTIICRVKTTNQSLSSTVSSNPILLNVIKEQTIFMKMRDLTTQQLCTLSSIYELTCHLVHLNDQFLLQFCDSVCIIANNLFIHILSDVIDNPSALQLVSSIIALLCFTLRELPENFKIVEKIVFHSDVNIATLLRNRCPLVKSRLCMLLRIIGRFCCFALQNVWSLELKEVLESLLNDENEDVQKKAKCTIDEFTLFSFYNKSG